MVTKAGKIAIAITLGLTVIAFIAYGSTTLHVTIGALVTPFIVGPLVYFVFKAKANKKKANAQPSSSS